MTYISKSADALNGYHFFFIGFLFIAALSCTALPANAQVTLHVTNDNGGPCVVGNCVPGSLAAQVATYNQSNVNGGTTILHRTLL
jgi:hypothetical protein